MDLRNDGVKTKILLTNAAGFVIRNRHKIANALMFTAELLLSLHAESKAPIRSKKKRK